MNKLQLTAFFSWKSVKTSTNSRKSVRFHCWILKSIVSVQMSAGLGCENCVTLKKCVSRDQQFDNLHRLRLFKTNLIRIYLSSLQVSIYLSLPKEPSWSVSFEVPNKHSLPQQLQVCWDLSVYYRLHIKPRWGVHKYSPTAHCPIMHVTFTGFDRGLFEREVL